MNSKPPALWELFKEQIKVGSFGFGGPLSTMALMREAFTKKNHWVSESSFLESLGFVKILPGPLSTLLACQLGWKTRGWAGGMISSLGFIIPSFLMILMITQLENSIPLAGRDFLQNQVLVVLEAVTLVIAGYTALALWAEVYRRPFRGVPHPQLVLACGLGAFFLSWISVPEPVILLMAGFSSFFSLRWNRKNLSVDLVSLFLVFFLTGLTVFGTGYMMIPHLQQILVMDKSWLSQSEFLRGITWGQMTPGPVVIASTYLGFQIRGLSGALVATLGMFLGPILLALLVTPFSQKLYQRESIQMAMVGVFSAVGATLLYAILRMAFDLHVSRPTDPWVIGAALLAVLALYRGWTPLNCLALATVVAALRFLFFFGNF